jgi:hypothetical protein
MSKLWTAGEKSEYRGCLSRMAASGKQTTPELDAKFCSLVQNVSNVPFCSCRLP